MFTQQPLHDHADTTPQTQKQAYASFDASPEKTAQKRRLDMMNSTVQRQSNEEEEPKQLVQKKAAIMQKASDEEEETQQHKPIQAKKNQTGMPDQLKTGIEDLSGLSLDPVRVHYNSSAPAQLNALAYAQGHDIHVGPGQEQHLPHEAWHVVQQMQGRVQPTTQSSEGVSINDNPNLEQEADHMGQKAMQLKITTENSPHEST